MMMELTEDDEAKRAAALVTLYGGLKKAKKQKMTPEEKEAKYADSLARIKMNGQRKHFDTIMSAMEKPFKNEEEDSVTMETLKEHFSLLDKTEILELFNKMKEFKTRAGKEQLKILMKTKKRSSEVEVSAHRTRTDVDACDQKRCGYTGDKIRMKCPKTALNLSFNVIETKRLKGGVINLDEGEALIWNQSNDDGARQVKIKKDYIDLKTPANYIREGGCGVAVSLDKMRGWDGGV